MSCDSLAQCTFSPTGIGTWSGSVTVAAVAYAATINTTAPLITAWTLAVNSNTYTADPSSTATPLNLVFASVTFPCGMMDVNILEGSCSAVDGGGSTAGAGCPSAPTLPTVLYVSASGFANTDACASCSDLDGTFACTLGGITCRWTSSPISGCSTTWTWNIIYTGTLWEVDLGSDIWRMSVTSPSLPVTLPLISSNPSGDFCTPPLTVTISE